MVIHPPILFLGYASTCIPFVIALGSVCFFTMGAGIRISAYWPTKFSDGADIGVGTPWRIHL